MMKKLALAAATALLFSAPALADPIEGNYVTPAGTKMSITACGGAFCVTAKSGAHSGKSIGSFTAQGGGYTGSLTDHDKGKTYKGKGKLSGSSLVMKGCVAAGLLCRSETWKRQ